MNTNSFQPPSDSLFDTSPHPLVRKTGKLRCVAAADEANCMTQRAQTHRNGSRFKGKICQFEVAILLFAAACLQGVAQLPPPDFNLGDVPPQTVWYGQTAAFRIHSGTLGAGAAFSMNASPQPQGVLSLDSASGQFSYTPDLADKTLFTVTFIAALGGQSDGQTVDFTPLPHLPPEQDVFGLKPVHAPPDPEDNNYITRNEVLSSASESFNNQMRTTRTITISGNTVVFQQGHPNGLFSYSDNDDIKQLDIHAQKVIFRDAFKVPQTAVTIHARELRFEDPPGTPEPASIVTTPRSITTRPAQFQNGAAGLNGGNMNLMIANLWSAGGTKIRFIADGGVGQPAGIGQDGALDGVDMPDQVSSGCARGAQAFEVMQFPNTTYLEINKTDCCPARLVSPVTHGYCGDPNNWPGNGDDAKSAGKPGDGGTGGTMYLLEDVQPYIRNEGGIAGSKGNDTKGRRGGLPNPANRWKVNILIGRTSPPPHGIPYPTLSVTNIVETHFSVPGKDMPAPEPDIPVGAPGSFTLIHHPMSWMSPFALRAIVAHAKDSYLYGYLDEAKQVLVDYSQLLDDFASSSDWSQLSDDWQLQLTAMRNEMGTLLHRINSNLDYFGNPPGWVPLLSFEANKLAFENEIERSIRQLYLSYWVGNAATVVQNRVDALNSARVSLKDEIVQFQNEYGNAIDLIPGLEIESIRISNRVQEVTAQLRQIEQDLMQRANNNVNERHKVPAWRKALGVAGTLLSVVPAGQPVLGAIGAGLNLISTFDPHDPLAVC
ncbi:MAG: hypothetical protein HY043_22235 [Verrucomicrobia bacterium]|nr:hypothetical protein [Verrucomicrobiota bacterium]